MAAFAGGLWALDSVHGRRAALDREFKAQKFRLAEEQDEFCSACVTQWHNRHCRDLTKVGRCHVCGGKYSSDDILLAQPVTCLTTSMASICCRLCFDVIRAQARAEQERSTNVV